MSRSQTYTCLHCLANPRVFCLAASNNIFTSPWIVVINALRFIGQKCTSVFLPCCAWSASTVRLHPASGLGSVQTPPAWYVKWNAMVISNKVWLICHYHPIVIRLPCRRSSIVWHDTSARPSTVMASSRLPAAYCELLLLASRQRHLRCLLALCPILKILVCDFTMRMEPYRF